MATIGAIGNASAVDLKAGGIGLEDFLKILLTQLTFQDPLKPVDNQQFMAQMAQFTSLEQTQQLNTKLETLLSTEASLQSVGLIGRTVDVAGPSGPMTGTVVALSLRGATPTMTLRTQLGTTVADVGLSQITAVR